MQNEVIVNVNNIYKYFGELKVLKGFKKANLISIA